MDYVEVVHILHPICNTSQLDGSSARLLRNQMTTYKLDAVYMPIPLDELVYVPILHPLGNESEPVFIQRNSEQW